MKIYSGRMLLLCAVLFINSIVVGVPSPIITYVQNKFNAVGEYFKDYQQCLFGKKSCTPREQQIKTATLTVGALVLLSTLWYIGTRVPNIIPIQQELMNVETKIASFKKEIEDLQESYKQHMKDIEIVEFNSPLERFPSLSDEIKDLEERVTLFKKTSTVDMRAYRNAFNNIKSGLQEIGNVIAGVKNAIAESMAK